MNIPEEVSYKSENGYRGFLYDYHHDEYCGYHFQMSIRDKDNHEVMHSYNATPKTYDELKELVDDMPSFLDMLKGVADE